MPLVIDPNYVDVDFRTFPQYVYGDIRPSENAMRDWLMSQPSYEDAIQLIESREWKQLAEFTQNNKSGMEWLVEWILNQGQEGSCVGNAWTQGYQVKWNFLYGLKRAVRMSAISGYKLIGRSPMSGAMVPDALEAGRQVGLLPLNTEENIERFGIDACMPATGFYTKFPAKHKETAKNFRIDQYYVIRTFEGLVTALLRGDPVIVGRAGHSILYLGILFINGKLFFIYVNSWGKWGMAMGNHAYGFGLDSEKYGRISANWAFAIRSVLTPDFMLAA